LPARVAVTLKLVSTVTVVAGTVGVSPASTVHSQRSVGRPFAARPNVCGAVSAIGSVLRDVRGLK
jgi:hypothetical protein